MSDEMKAALEHYLKALLSAAEQGALFVAEQVPLVVQEKLAFDFWWAVLGLSVGVASLIASVLTWRWSFRTMDKHDVPAPALPAFTALLSFVLIPITLRTIIMITVAPRLYIIEWLRGAL